MNVQRCVSLVLLVVSCVYCQDDMENLSMPDHIASRRFIKAPTPECPPGYTWYKPQGRCAVLERRSMQSFGYDDGASGLARIIPHFPTRKCPPGTRRTSNGKCREETRRRMKSYYYDDASGYLAEGIPPRCPPGYMYDTVSGRCRELVRRSYLTDYASSYGEDDDASGYLTDIPPRRCPPGYMYDAASGMCRELAIEESSYYNY